MAYQVGDEFYDGVGNWIIVAVEQVPTADESAVVEYVTSFDYEGCIDRQPAVVFDELVEELEMTPVQDQPLEDRLAIWRHEFNNFPL